jgi:heterotetrameric sarcosine oxidase gamma subunit
VTPNDVGLASMIAKGKGDFVGKRSLQLADMQRRDRRQLVGLRTLDPRIVLEEGAQLVAGPDRQSLGHVTSAYWSEPQRRSIALALLSNGRARIGSTLKAISTSRTTDVEVVDPSLRLVRPESIAIPAVPPMYRPPAPADYTKTAPCPEATLTMLPAVTRISVRAGTVAAATLGAALGVLLGSVPGRAVTSRDRAALWLGPDEWLVLAPAESGLARRAAASLGGLPASVVDVSHSTAAIEVAGPRAAWCINAFNALDLDLRVFPVDGCTRTLFGKAEIVLWRTAAHVFRIEVARSFARYVWACLEETRQEFLCQTSAQAH